MLLLGPISLVVHWEGNNNIHRTVRRIKELGKRAGVAINPATAAAVLEEILPEIDLVLVMTVKSRFWTPAIPSRHVAKDPTRSPDDRVSKNFL